MGGGKNERKLEGAVVGPGGAGGNLNVRSVAGDDTGARAPGVEAKVSVERGRCAATLYLGKCGYTRRRRGATCQAADDAWYGDNGVHDEQGRAEESRGLGGDGEERRE